MPLAEESHSLGVIGLIPYATDSIYISLLRFLYQQYFGQCFYRIAYFCDIVIERKYMCRLGA